MKISFARGEAFRFLLYRALPPRSDAAMPGPASAVGAFASLETQRFLGHRKSVTAVAWSRDGTRLAACGDAWGALVYDVERAIQTASKPEPRWHAECKGHTLNVEQVVWSPIQPNVLATAGLDRLVNVFDLRKGPAPVHSQKLDEGCLNLDWSPDGRWVAVGDRRDKVYLIDTSKWEVCRAIEFQMEMNQFCWTASGKRMLLTRGDGTVQVAEWPSLRSITYLEGHVDRCYAVAADPAERYIAVTSADSCVSVWDAKSLVNLFTIDRSETVVRLAGYSHDSRILALAGESNGIHLTDADTGGPLFSIPTIAPPNSIHWHPTRPLLAYALEKSPRERYSSGIDTSVPTTFVWGYGRDKRRP